jgi:hypothetical protein
MRRTRTIQRGINSAHIILILKNLKGREPQRRIRSRAEDNMSTDMRHPFGTGVLHLNFSTPCM